MFTDNISEGNKTMLTRNVDDNFRGGGNLSFVGTWSSYANYPSGHILINTIERGAWVVKVQNALP